MRASLVAVVALALGIVGCAEGYDDSDLAARVSELEQQVAALSATPAVATAVVLAKEVRPVVIGDVMTTIPFCVIYKIAGSEQERCMLNYFWTAAANASAASLAEAAANNDRVGACFEQTKVGGTVPECWWSP